MTAWIFTILSGGAVLVLLRVTREASTLQRPVKMFAATGFIAVAVSVGAGNTGFGRVVLAGLVLSWLGDMKPTVAHPARESPARSGPSRA